MKTVKGKFTNTGMLVAVIVAACIVLATVPAVMAVPLPGGTLNPLTIEKYVIPLVIPPEMPMTTVGPAPAADYDIAVRQFQQQILPGGIWTTVNPAIANPLPATTLWSYGLAEDVLPPGFTAPSPLSAGITFNYPALTIEADVYNLTTVRWINDLQDANGPLPHLLPVDQTLHWANPAADECKEGPPRTDCATLNPDPYLGPVPIVTHVHGAHVNPESDGYPEAWWLPGSANPTDYQLTGTIYTQYDNTNAVPGSAYYGYENTQPATTLWYHDHSLGMTRLNVYAGPAGFWLLRGGVNGDDYVDNGTTLLVPFDGVLPGPAPAGAGDPNFNTAYRATIREIPIVIQDRSFDADGSLWYPTSRIDFDGYTGPYIPDEGSTVDSVSDIAPTWNPEAFFNVMVVNGVSWPTLEVAPALYRFRLLNGCNSRFLNLSMVQVNGKGQPKRELPFYQIGAEQGFLPQVVRIETGFATPLFGDGSDVNPKYPTCIKKNGKAAKNCTIPVGDPLAQQALLMGLAERADVIVDFRGRADGDIVRMLNTAPDAPFGGFPDIPADPATTGQVMQFVVNSALLQPGDALATDPSVLVLPAEGRLADLGFPVDTTRQISLNEEESATVCVDELTWTVVYGLSPPDCDIANGIVPMAPKAALLGLVSPTGGIPLTWSANITENPQVGDTEIWEIYNFTVDAHPIHLHLVRFEVVERQAFVPNTDIPTGPIMAPQPWETGYKDTVIAYPGEITRIKANFDQEGLYVWHCHIVEHEDNEMMRPYYVGNIDNSPVP